MKALGQFAFIALLGVFSFLYIGWALSLIWGWYMVALGLPAVPYPVFVGAAFMMDINSTYQRKISKQDLENTDNGVIALALLVKVFVVLLTVGIAGLLSLVLI